MSRRKTIIKRLDAIQNVGAMDVLCCDKTGTLTEDRIVLERHVDPTGREDDAVLALAWLNSAHQTGLRNLLDVAVLEHAERHEPPLVDRAAEKVDEIPWDFARRRMSVVVQRPSGEQLLVCKGAVDEVLAACAWWEQAGVRREWSDADRARAREVADAMQATGMRLVAVAHRTVTGARRAYTVADEADLTFAGLIGFLDPPKPSAEAAVRALREHGVTVKVLTGDSPLVARTVCRAVGIDARRVVTGAELATIADDAMPALAAEVDVFAKLSPADKERIVRALRASGRTVGFVGDGINDAPALRAADVGISVDSATDIARESASVILLDRDLMVLEEAIVEGRRTFANIMKYLKMTASSNFGNVFSVLVASAFLPFLPMLPLHLLTQNLLYDLSQTSIPWDRVDEEYLRRPRQWRADDIGRFMLAIGPISSIFDILCFLLMWHVFGANAPERQALFQSGWFVVGLLTQTLIVHMIRTEKVPFLQSVAAPPVLALTAIIMAVGVVIPFSALGRSIGLVPLPPDYFPWLVALLLGYATLTQVLKTAYVRRFETWL
jgi:Mg2+-importing ATPase